VLSEEQHQLAMSNDMFNVTATCTPGGLPSVALRKYPRQYRKPAATKAVVSFVEVILCVPSDPISTN
jgi:hypothetical protein